MERIYIRPPAKRIAYAVGTALIVALLLFRFYYHPSSSAFAPHGQRWASASGPLRDIRNATLGVSLNFGFLFRVMVMRRDTHACGLGSLKRYLLSACQPDRTAAMAWSCKRH
jgi:hypothetical protein